MKYRLFINLFLFIAVVGLALFLFNNSNKEDTTGDILLTTIDPEKINRIEISGNRESRIIFKKENGNWSMQSPYALPANPVRINSMLGLLRTYSYTQIDRNNVELEQFKLDTPDVSVRFNELQIDFGDTSPLGKQRYVLVNDTIHLINDNIYHQLKTSATFFLNNSLLQAGADITAITFPESELRQQSGVWHIDPQTNISGDDIVRLVDAWKNLQAISIREYENNEITGSIKIEMKNREPVEFAIVSPAPQLILARPDIGIQYHISGYDAEKLFLNKYDKSTKSLEEAGEKE